MPNAEDWKVNPGAGCGAASRRRTAGSANANTAMFSAISSP